MSRHINPYKYLIVANKDDPEPCESESSATRSSSNSESAARRMPGFCAWVTLTASSILSGCVLILAAAGSSSKRHTGFKKSAGPRMDKRCIKKLVQMVSIGKPSIYIAHLVLR
jgi:hypothetical protein